MIILNTTKLTEIFVIVDDFMKEFEPYTYTKLLGTQVWKGKMSKSEMMTIVIFFHLSGIRCFSPVNRLTVPTCRGIFNVVLQLCYSGTFKELFSR